MRVVPVQGITAIQPIVSRIELLREWLSMRAFLQLF